MNRMNPLYSIARRFSIGAIFLSAFMSTALAQELYVGANYHPHDSDSEDWSRDIKLMQAAGLKVVRLGHLAWDSYEPADGVYQFEWFDEVMDRMHAAGIKVILDIAVRPAPLWLHRKHPTIRVSDANGNAQYPNTRYMEDVGDPAYQEHALRYADVLTKRYGRHPALLAFGIDNEPGDGPISYSETVRGRFIVWLKQKYPDLGGLNQAWAGQRWSRRISDYEEVGLPLSGAVAGAPERTLDFRRFISDEVNGFLDRLISQVNKNAPEALTTTNMWYYSGKKYFDYSELAYPGRITRAGNGFYPGNSLIQNGGLRHALFGIARIQFENTTPFWCTEFTTMTAVPGSIRKSAYASLLLGNQLVCGWTWQSMHAGEEQYLQGMVDWDGRPNRKYDEYKQVAEEFKKIEAHGFPYRVQAEVALAFSFPSQIASGAFPEAHDNQMQTAFDAVSERNLDLRVVEISRSELPYKVLIVSGVAVMDEPTAAKIRHFVQGGGTVIMTGYSAMVDETNQVFSGDRPGRLADVFGIRVAGFEEPENLNELTQGRMKGKGLEFIYGGSRFGVESPRFDVIEARTASVRGTIVGLDREYPLITVNRFGAGRAIYVGIPARKEILGVLLDAEVEALGIRKGPAVPTGVLARQTDSRHLLFVNLDGVAKVIPLAGELKSLLRDRTYHDEFTLGAFDADFIEIE